MHLFSTALGMNVRPRIVSLPNLNNSIANWLPVQIQDAACQMSHFADGWRDRIVEKQQIVIGIGAHCLRFVTNSIATSGR